MLEPVIDKKITLSLDDWSIGVESDPDHCGDDATAVRITYNEGGEEKQYIFVPQSFIGPLIDALKEFSNVT